MVPAPLAPQIPPVEVNFASDLLNVAVESLSPWTPLAQAPLMVCGPATDTLHDESVTKIEHSALMLAVTESRLNHEPSIDAEQLSPTDAVAPNALQFSKVSPIGALVSPKVLGVFPVRSVFAHSTEPLFGATILRFVDSSVYAVFAGSTFRALAAAAPTPLKAAIATSTLSTILIRRMINAHFHLWPHLGRVRDSRS